jgi:hypothetical protein
MSYQLPEDLSALTAVDQIDAEIDNALDAFRALGLNDESSDDDITEAERLRDAINALREHKAATVAEAAERAERIAALATVGDPEDDEPEAPAADDEPPADAEVVVPDEVLTPEPVTAAAAPKPSPVARAAAAAPEVIVPTRQVASLIAAADVPGFSNGQSLDGMKAATSAVLQRIKALPKTNLATASGGVRQRYGAALIQKTAVEDLVQTQSGGDDYDLVWRAGDEKRLPGGSLVAAGGWCAPSETLYDLCQYETLEGMLSIPEMTVTRGGIRFTEGPTFSDIYAACGFVQTEAEAIAGDCKDCCTVSCPSFDEVRLDAIGLCVKSPILTEHAYPELVQRFTEGALVAHQHKVNKYIIDSMVLAAGTAITGVDGGAIGISMENLVLAAIGMRYSYRLSQTAPIEVVAPYWLKELIRSDFAIANDRKLGGVSDAELNAWFTDRNLSVQWVYDFQDPTVSGCTVTIPSEVSLLLYPAGTWTKGSANVINLDAVYDSPNLEANQYTALFVEEGILAVQRCTHTCHIKLPVCVSGKGVLDDIDVCIVGTTAAP